MQKIYQIRQTELKSIVAKHLNAKEVLEDGEYIKEIRIMRQGGTLTVNAYVSKVVQTKDYG